MSIDRRHWLQHIKEVARSRHYTWLPRGLGGEKVDAAMTYLLTDIMHVCKMAGVPFDNLLANAKSKFEEEEFGDSPQRQPPAQPLVLSPDAVDAIVTAFQTDDPFAAEFMRAQFAKEEIVCRVDSSLQGGLKGNVDAKVVVNSEDADRAAKIVQQVQESAIDVEA